MFRKFGGAMARHDLLQDFLLHKKPRAIARRALVVGEEGVDHAQKAKRCREVRLFLKNAFYFAARLCKSISRFDAVAFPGSNDAFPISVWISNAVVFRAIARIVFEDAGGSGSRSFAQGVERVVNIGGHTGILGD